MNGAVRHSLSIRRRVLRSVMGAGAPYLYLVIGALLFAFAVFEPSPVPASSPRVLVRGDLRDSFVESRPDGSVRAVQFSLRNSPRRYWTTETGAALTPTRTDRGDVHIAFYVDGPLEAPAGETTALRAYRVVANGKALALAETAVRTGAGSLRLVLRVLGTGGIVLGAIACVRNFRRQRRPVARSA